MSIDARVDFVVIHENGGGELRLIDRPPDGIKGQSVLRFDAMPEEVTALNGLDIWGGDGDIMLGREAKIAKRISYQKIEFVARPAFLAAVKAYHEQRRADATPA